MAQVLVPTVILLRKTDNQIGLLCYFLAALMAHTVRRYKGSCFPFRTASRRVSPS